MRPLDEDKIIDAVGQRVAEIRRTKGWTQQDLADTLDVTLRYVQAIEGGERNPSLRVLVRLANALEVPLAPLFEAPAPTKRRAGRPRKK